jgi:hypothetical protein
LQFGAGAAPWVHLIGRGLLLLVQLLTLLQLHADCPIFVLLDTKTVQGSYWAWSRIADLLQQQLLSLSVQGIDDAGNVKMSYVQRIHVLNVGFYLYSHDSAAVLGALLACMCCNDFAKASNLLKASSLSSSQNRHMPVVPCM